MPSSASIQLDQSSTDRCLITLSGDWTQQADIPRLDETLAQVQLAGCRQLTIDGSAVSDWDTLFVSALYQLAEYARRNELALDERQIPEGARRLLKLAMAVPEREGARKTTVKKRLFRRVGERALDIWHEAGQMIHFLGQAVSSLGRFVRHDAQFRDIDFACVIQQVGAQALPIVSLISLLVGMILAYVGALQLEAFGAQIYVADLVGLGVSREMGAMMTAVIMAGRSGAAFASQLGTMQVNEEIDALRTMGFSPIDFLVLPRMLGLILMMPLLCLYADFMGVLGGALVGAMTLDITFFEYYAQTVSAIDLNDITAGLVKSVVFGVLVAMAGCMRGIQCGRSASAVGEATTSAVVTGIILIVVADAILTIVYDAIGL